MTTEQKQWLVECAIASTDSFVNDEKYIEDWEREWNHQFCQFVEMIAAEKGFTLTPEIMEELRGMI